MLLKLCKYPETGLWRRLELRTYMQRSNDTQPPRPSATAAAAQAARSQAAFFAEQGATTMTPADRARAAAAMAAAAAARTRPASAAAAAAAGPQQDRFREYAEADVREARAAQKAAPSTVEQMRREKAETAARAEAQRAVYLAEKAAKAQALAAAAAASRGGFTGGPPLTAAPTPTADMSLAGLNARYLARDATHDWLRDVALPREGPATTNPLVTNLPWGQGLTEERIVLDSWAASRREPARGQWAFTISPQQYDNSSAGARLDLENIDQISVQQFSMPLPLPVPYVTNDDTSITSSLPVLTANPATWLPGTPYDQLMSLKRIYVRIRELDVMGYWGRSQRRWHFAFDVTPANSLSDSSDAAANCIRLTPTLDGKTIMFTTPIQQLPQITLEFMSPDAPVGFNGDFFGVALSQSGGAGTSVRFTTTTATNLVAGDHVYFENVAFASPTPDTTKIQNYLNAGPPGRVVGAGPTSTVFELNPTIIAQGVADFTPLTAPQLYVVKNRFLMPLVFRGVRTTPTNAILRAPRP